MLDARRFRYLPAERVRRFDLADSTEVIVGGDATAPDSIYLELADWVLEQLGAVSADARHYLSNFVDFQRLQSVGEWNLAGVEIGRVAHEPYDEFVLLFELDNDPYGLWSVRFRRGPGQRPKGFTPFLFSRCQC